MHRRDLLTGGASLAGAAVLTRCSSRAGGSPSISLIDSRGGAQVVAGPAELPSARYFSAVFEELTGAKLEIVSTPGAGNRPLVLIGNLQDDARLRELAGAERASKVTEQGILLATANEGEHPAVLVAGGTRVATPGTVGAVPNCHLDACPSRASASVID